MLLPKVHSIVVLRRNPAAICHNDVDDGLLCTAPGLPVSFNSKGWNRAEQYIELRSSQIKFTWIMCSRTVVLGISVLATWAMCRAVGPFPFYLAPFPLEGHDNLGSITMGPWWNKHLKIVTAWAPPQGPVITNSDSI